MEMISAVKMRKAVASVLATRNYADLAWRMLLDVSRKTDVSLHPLLANREVKRIGIILITGNRGLAGGFSSRLLAEVNQYITAQKSNSGVMADIIVAGKRGRGIYHRFGHNIAAEFEKKDLSAGVNDVLPITRLAISDYTGETYDKIIVAYTDYVSAVRQVPRVRQILPLTTQDDMLGNVGGDSGTSAGKGIEFKFEPGAAAVLETLLPRMVEMQIYQAILESDASEHSARMMAMKNASEAAEDMITELNYNFNKARQSAITQEISEIVSGAAAL